MKLVKTVNISSDGSLHFHYEPITLIKKNNRIIFQEMDDKNFILNKKKATKLNVFRKSFNYKNKYT